MAVSKGFLDALSDALSPLGQITVRRMFGSAGLYCDGQVFALAYDDTLYLKVDDTTRAAFTAEACGPFVYPKRDGEQVIAAYHRAPDRLMDDADELRAWVRQAVAVGRRTATRPAPRPQQSRSQRKTSRAQSPRRRPPAP